MGGRASPRHRRIRETAVDCADGRGAHEAAGGAESGGRGALSRTRPRDGPRGEVAPVDEAARRGCGEKGVRRAVEDKASDRLWINVASVDETGRDGRGRCRRA